MPREQRGPEAAGPSRPFYGWWMVLACLVIAVVGWSLTIFGMGVYIHVLADERDFSIGSVSSAVTMSYLVSALCLMSVGAAVARWGPKPVIAFGAVALGSAVLALSFVSEIWHVFVLFAFMGIGQACLSTTAISTTLAPWFDRHQGRAVSTALLGASIGGIIGTPLLLSAVSALGFQRALLIASLCPIVILIPIAIFVLKKTPQEIGLLPDGDGHSQHTTSNAQPRWTRRGAMATRQLRTQTFAFAIGLFVQVGFLSHHVPMMAPTLGEAGASIAVSAAAVSAFVGRVALARFADRIDVRLTAGGVLALAALSLALMAVVTSPAGLLIASVCYGLTTGNVTTLPPLIARREFGAASFGAVFGVASAMVAFAMGFGPAFYGVLRDAFGSYGAVLAIAAVLDLIAAGVVIWGGRKPLTPAR
ncbi:MFS transporter [Cumulibacter soli]|uniref:MFS transporter n=1 Tax=Cumulibacter soli TaxID=2546344 RepID=UPI0010689EF4|nr:MFS transporter [Cumulibacter soli]